MERIKNINLFDIKQTIASSYFEKYEFPYEIIPIIEQIIIELQTNLKETDFIIKDDIVIHKRARVSEKAVLVGPLIIDENAEIRPFSYLRGKVIIGKNVVVGNSTELKNCLLFNNCEVPHFNYVGDSILGYKSHLGAGVILSNLKADKSEIILKLDNQKIKSNLIKFGAIIGDKVEIGCNAVLNPGTIIGKNSIIYPLANVRGYIPKNKIYKTNKEIIEKN